MHDEEMQELLDVPLRAGELGVSEGVVPRKTEEGWTLAWFTMLAADIAASAAFWWVLFQPIPNMVFYGFLITLFLAMVAWRLYRAHVLPSECVEQVPYTTGYASIGGKELFLVATIHISPRAPKDVEAVIEQTRPDVAMIELDEERLDRMRDKGSPRQHGGEPSRSSTEDLQMIRISQEGSAPTPIYAQRALWNAEFAGQTIRGDIVFDEDNCHGLSICERGLQGRIQLVQRGGPSGEFAPFALKAHNGYKAGARAVLVINDTDRLPPNRVGSGSVTGDLRVALKTCNCGFPPVPLLLLPHTEGDRLRALAKQPASNVSVEFQVRPDHYPRRTLRLRLCQACALMFSGIGILYGIIQCFAVEVGGEFLAAEEAAAERGIPCTCIDVDLNRFWSRLGLAVLPTPCNIFRSLTAWLAFPRVAFHVLFPPRGNVDVLGGMLLHAASFPLRTWIAFILAGFCASTVTSKILELLGYGAEQAAEKSGAVSQEDRDQVQTLIMLLIELYLLPQIYDSVAASRDEAMYQSIVRKSRELGARRMVVVVGSGHANGILQRARCFGL